MNITVHSPWTIDRLLRLGWLSLTGVASGLLLLWLGLWCFYPWAGADMEELDRGVIRVKRGSFAYESIGSGALELNPRPAWGWMTHLVKELSVIAHNSRPDATGEEAKILLSLSAVKEPLAVASGKTLFVDAGESGPWTFSEATQSMWIKPILLENGRVLIEAGRNVGIAKEERGQFVLPVGGSQGKAKEQFLHSEALASLKKGHFFGKDVWIERYGGVEFASWKDRYKIELGREGATYVVYVMAGDYLIWNGTRWEKAERDQLTSGVPLAVVKVASAQGIELTVWDPSGFYPALIELIPEPALRLVAAGDLVPSQLKLRTTSQVSAVFGKKRMLLKSGDWVLKTPTGWHVLRRQDEVENYLYHHLKGELFIIDGLVKEHERWVLKATLFNEVRTQMQAVSIPIESERRPSKVKKK